MEIKIVGLRPGEKLYEELMMDEEQDKMRRTQHNKIFVASPRTIDLPSSTSSCRRWKPLLPTTMRVWCASWRP